MIPAKSHIRAWLGAFAVVAYGGIVVLAVFWPTPLDQGFEPSIGKIFEVLHRNGVPLWFGYNKLEFTANVLMFVPLGFLVALLLPRQFWWLALIICPMFSTAIEFVQSSVLEARFASALDVLANSVGALIGAVVAFFIRALVYRRDEIVLRRALWEARNLR